MGGGDGQYGFGKRNAMGERLLEFATDNQLVICNTVFKHKACHRWTWRTRDNKCKNKIDLILIVGMWKNLIQNCKSFQGADRVEPQPGSLGHFPPDFFSLTFPPEKNVNNFS